MTTNVDSKSTGRRADRFRVVVVGAGAFGSWTALHLRNAGADVTLVDAWGPGNSRSSSGGETRLIRSIYGADRVYIEWVARAFREWDHYQTVWGTELYGRTGALWMCTGDDAYVRLSQPIMDELGLVLEKCDLATIGARFPQVNFDGVVHAYFEPEAGFLRARQACEVVTRAFCDLGGQLAIGSATPLAGLGEGVRAIRVGKTTLSAEAFVFACGPWLGQLFPDVLGEAIRPTRQEVFYFGAPTGNDAFDAGVLPVWVELGERIFYGVGQVDYRGVKIACDHRDDRVFDPTNGDRTPSREGLEDARRKLALRFPLMKDAPLVESRVCQYENSPDGHLVVDRHPTADNVWIVGGGSGHGFKLGPIVGSHAAGCVLGDEAPLATFSLSRLAELGSTSTQFDVQHDV